MKDRTKYDLNKQSIAAAELIREIGSGDAELTHDMVEGETDLFEAISAALAEIDQCDILASGLQSHILEMQKRLSRIKNRARSEERRVGKECRPRRWPYHYKKKKKSQAEVHDHLEKMSNTREAQ